MLKWFILLLYLTVGNIKTEQSDRNRGITHWSSRKMDINCIKEGFFLDVKNIFSKNSNWGGKEFNKVKCLVRKRKKTYLLRESISNPSL